MTVFASLITYIIGSAFYRWAIFPSMTFVFTVYHGDSIRVTRHKLNVSDINFVQLLSSL